MIPLTSLSVKIGDGICGICSTKTRSCSRLSCEQSLHLHDIENTIHLKRQSSPVSFPIENPLSAPNCTCRVISNHWVARSLDRLSVGVPPNNVFFRRQSQSVNWGFGASASGRSRSPRHSGQSGRPRRQENRALSCSPENGSGWSILAVLWYSDAVTAVQNS